MRRILRCTLGAFALLLLTAVPAQAIPGPHYWMYSDEILSDERAVVLLIRDRVIFGPGG